MLKILPFKESRLIFQYADGAGAAVGHRQVQIAVAIPIARSQCAGTYLVLDCIYGSEYAGRVIFQYANIDI